MKLVIDTNCIIDLEIRGKNYGHLMKIVSKWKSGDIDLGVVAISASENQKGGWLSNSFGDFQRKLINAGLQGVEILSPMAFWDVTYYDQALWSDVKMKELDKNIHKALFPGSHIEFPNDDDSMKRKWRNKKCDVQIVWAIIYHKWDVLVTSDDNFHEKEKYLLPLGLKNVLYPFEAANRVN